MQALLAIVDDATLSTAKLIARRQFAPNLTLMRFFCGIFSAFAWQAPVPRRALRHAMAAEKLGSVSCHSLLPPVRRMPAARRQDSPHRG
jgi:hypothetical protein